MNNRQKELLQAELNNEKKAIKELEQVYTQAIKDCEKKIRELSMRSDMENLQSIVYQKQYQQAIKGQLEGVLEQLHSNEFATISEYLNRCYTDGFVGSMYDLAGQGIPLIVPINQNQVVKAIQIDSKLSKTLYESLGEDVKDLKKAVSSQVSRGIANGSSWNDIAKTLTEENMKNTPFGKAINNSIRIARTEGHRVQTAAKMDAMTEAKSKGADVVKQWDASLDGRTRDTHRKLDGQIRELDEPFEVYGMKADAPGQFGDPAEDCNCRCTLLQRAKWALDESELETLQERSEFFDLDKTDDFNDFKDKYLNISEEDIAEYERQYGIPYGEIAKNVDFDYINSVEYKEKFSTLTDNQDINNSIYNTAKSMLEHCDGTDHEDMYLFNANDGTIFANVINSDVASGIIYTDEFKEKLAESKENVIPIIAMHNHPQGTPPSADDFGKAYDNGYKFGIAIGHNGQLYVYETPSSPISKELADGITSDIQVMVQGGIDIDRACEMVYNANGLKYYILEGSDSGWKKTKE